ncbi:MAG: nucleotide sugar dehydrogenase, partial [Pseudomonadota bacterium]
MKVSVIGTGYVGLVSGVCLAEKGHQVVCVDIDPAKVDMINAGEPPIFEAGLEELLKNNIGSRLSASTDLRTAVLESDISLIAVGTPFDGDKIDLQYIRDVSREIGEVLRDKTSFHAVIVKSTVVPGTTDGVVAPILAEASGGVPSVDFGVGMNPEFLKEGDAIVDFMNPDRIVLGGMDDQTIDMLSELYSVFEGVDLVRCDTRTAEMIKYTANSLLATLISFSNEIGNLCAEMGVDTLDAMNGMHLDKRFMPILADGTRVRPGMI